MQISSQANDRTPIVRQMTEALRSLSGFEYLATAVALLRRVRLEHQTAGVWEAADYEWWWRKQRTTDADQLFWFEQGEPYAAATLTDWGRSTALDILTMPNANAGLVAEVFHTGLQHATKTGHSTIEVMVDDENDVLIGLLTSANFSRLPDAGSSAWMDAADRPQISPLADGFSLLSRHDLREQPHHYIAKNGVDVEQRLNETSMYRADLDLAAVDQSGDVVGYGLFWFDPVTGVGFVEPLGVDEEYRRLGIAQHILTSGLDKLAAAGAERLKINFENDNPASATLYPSLGFSVEMATSIFVRE